eukprot:1471260-Amphidinium_carterae.1
MEVDTPAIMLKDGSMEQQEDLRFRLEVEPVYSRYYNDGVPPRTVSHHCVSYCVSTYPNEDIAKYLKAKPFRKRKTPTQISSQT